MLKAPLRGRETPPSTTAARATPARATTTASMRMARARRPQEASGRSKLSVGRSADSAQAPHSSRPGGGISSGAMGRQT